MRFTFPNPPPLSPPVLGLHGEPLRPAAWVEVWAPIQGLDTRPWRVTAKKRSCFLSWLSGVTFGYEGQKPLFKNLDFGIDMDSRSELVLGGQRRKSRGYREWVWGLFDHLPCFRQSASWVLTVWGRAPCSCC